MVDAMTARPKEELTTPDPGLRADVLYADPRVQIELYRRCFVSPGGGHETLAADTPCIIIPWAGMRLMPVRGSVATEDFGWGNAFVANPNELVLAESGQSYHQQVLTPGDEASVVIKLNPAWLKATHRLTVGAAGGHGADVLFSRRRVPLASRDFLLAHQLVQNLRHSSPLTTVDEETVMGFVRMLLRQSWSTDRRPTSLRRAPTVRAHRGVVHAVQLYLTQYYDRRIVLDDLSRHVHMSEYHLCRVFKREADLSIHQYLTRLRLRLSLRWLTGRHRVSDIAERCGYSSHAHFTNAFRREFGIAPSQVRHQFGRGKTLTAADFQPPQKDR